MNICFVNSTRKWGGVKSWTLDVARGLIDLNHNVLIVGRAGPFIDKAVQSGIEAKAVTFGPDFSPILIWTFIRLFKLRKIDVVVVNVGKDMRSAAVAARILGIPVVHRVGLAGDMLNTWKVRLMHRWIQPYILVPCEEIKRGLVRNLPYLRPEEITVILTGKDVSLTPSATAHTPLRFISSSQLNADKGHREALLALSTLKDASYNFEYHILGTGKVEKELKLLAKDLGLDKYIVWHGFQHDVRPSLRQADVFLLLSRSEGLPNALLEAMSEGLACVARNVGGVEECWPADTGFLLPPDISHELLSSVLAEILSMPVSKIIEIKNRFWRHAQLNPRAVMVKKVEKFFQLLRTNNE